MKEGFYVGPTGMIVEIVYDDGPGFNTRSLMYSVDGKLYKDFDIFVQNILEGWEFIEPIL